MVKIELWDFKAAVAHSVVRHKRQHLLLGNGFSIACKPDIFTYGSLFDEASKKMPSELTAVFETLNTQDFEVAIKGLQTSAALSPIYGADAAAKATMLEHAELLKALLIDTIATRHPDRPGDIADERYEACRRFLSHFLGGNDGCVYTLNYDLLLYWAVMHNNDKSPTKLAHDDGFRKDEYDYDAPYVVWHGETKSHGQRVHYLHGALHLYDGGYELQKYTWINTGQPLIEQAREALERDYFPLFVSEADTEAKLARIQHSAYLHHSYKSYVGVLNNGGTSALFIYGHSFAPNDDHVPERIVRGKIPTLYVSLYGDPTSLTNEYIIERAQRLVRLRGDALPLEVVFFQAESAAVWN